MYLREPYFSMLAAAVLTMLLAGNVFCSQGDTERVSQNSTGEEGNGYSYNASNSSKGRYVAFDSDATNLDQVNNDTNGARDVFVRDRIKGW